MNAEEANQDVSSAHIADTSGMKELQDAMNKINELNANNESDTQLEDTIQEEQPEEQVEKEETASEENLSEQEDEEVTSDEETTENTDSEIKKTYETKKQKEKKFWKERREKYKALAERDRLASELEELRSQRDKALEVGNYHYGQNAYADLEKAELMHDKAIEEGDAKGLREANKAIIRATNAIDEIERWNYHNQQNAKASEQNERQANIANVQREIAQDWLESNDEINPSSVNYNPQMAQKVGAFINQLDRSIAESGKSEYYFSEPYFEAIDKHLSKLKKQSQKSNTPPASINNVSGVKKSYQSGSSTAKSKQTIVLTADEKRMASNAGITEEEWLKYKIDDLNKHKKRA